MGGTFMILIMIFAILPIYWGALYKTPVRKLKGWVVDFDGGAIGQTVSQALVSNQGPGKVEWTVVPAANFPGGVEDLAHAVRHEDVWVAISINPESSTRLTAALASPNAAYDGTQAITGYGVEARTALSFRPSVQAALDAISQRYAQQTAKNAANSPILASILSASPQTIVQPVSYTINNLIPFDQPVATAATFVGMLYQLILGFFIVMIALGAREASGYDKTLSTKNLIILRLSSSLISYLFVSLFYCLLNLAFSIDVTRKFGRPGFLVFWMVNYVGMVAVYVLRRQVPISYPLTHANLSAALALESMITLLTPKGMPFFMLLWIISNLAVSVFPIEVLPIVYRYGYAVPFYNLSRAIRTIVFGTRNRVGTSVGILFAWIAISCITLSLFQWLVRRPSATPAPPQDPPAEVMDPEKQNGQSNGFDDREDTVQEALVNFNGKKIHGGVSAETLQKQA
ncbi:hypothetical protein DFP72DRAFT_1090248 [Ephemerocybe angulata]|uniref:DUF3533 domain-containing protein n=1 Tax=Ephemerocybe angulata TaxID=980116 RepID=A0A8H6I991_9AGAR|nr:hypothetical protein DFP72DRAFT_1090248 [Tulosesus angulatus]